MTERSEHMQGLLRLVNSNDKERVERWIQNPRGREKLLEWLAHKGGLSAQYSAEPPRGQRDGESLLSAMRRLGAPPTCYVISSDGRLDDTFGDLAHVLTLALVDFTHGTIISAIPGKLALFRSAYPHRHLIVQRQD
jgi:hypothetical protein